MKIVPPVAVVAAGSGGGSGGGGTPGGSAGGDLGGPFPGPIVVGIGGFPITDTPSKPIVVGIGGFPITDTPSNGEVPTFDSGTGEIHWELVTSTSVFSGARAYHNTTQTVGASITVLDLNSEDFDTANYHDNSTNNSRLTAPSTGYYLVTGHAQFANNVICILGLYLNGSPVRGSAVSMSDPSTKLQTTQIISMTAGQYVELWAYQAIIGNVGDASVVENQTTLSIQFLGV